MRRAFLVVLSWSLLSLPLAGQQTAPPPQRQPPSTLRAPTRADILRGEYGRYRANNDLLYYHLDVRVDPEKKSISGKNTIRFKMLKDDTRIQLDLYANLTVDKILLGSDAAEVRARAQRRLRRFPGDAASRARPTRSTSTTPARRRSRAASAASRSARIRPAATGSTPPAKAKAPASGGRTRISGATKSRAWRSASPFPTTWWTSRTASSWARPTSATATRAGTGACTIRSTTTTSR